MKILRTLAVVAAMFLFSASLFAEEPHPDAAAVLVVCNRNEARSEEVARHYLARRGVPEANLCVLDCPAREEITRAEYNDTILKPVRDFVQKQDLMAFGTIQKPGGGETVAAVSTRLKYVVLCYGVPLKIAHDPKEPVTEAFQKVRAELLTNAAAVDSELANLPFPLAPITAFLPNPLYRRTFGATPGWNHRLLCVARLDGPAPEDALRLVDDAIEAERLGLYGRGFFDMRGLPDSNPGYKMGDDWIRRAWKLFEEKGWETIADEKEAVFGDDTDASSCAVYAGWYAGQATGPFVQPGFRFRKGAVAYHIHSWSANTLRSATANWTGPLVARGAAATLGCVYEPYLQMTANVDILFERLLEGRSFGEAAWSSQQFLSWMNTVVGDPLYRPFAVPCDERIAALEARFDALTENEKTALAWACRFKAGVLFREGKKDEAFRLAYEQAVRLRERTLWVGLANIYLLAGENRRAAEAVKVAVRLARGRDSETSTLHFAARTCAGARDWDAALDFYRALLIEFPKIHNRDALCREAAAVARRARREADAQFFDNLTKPVAGK